MIETNTKTENWIELFTDSNSVTTRNQIHEPFIKSTKPKKKFSK
jgi:hypothetical protein